MRHPLLLSSAAAGLAALLLLGLAGCSSYADRVANTCSQFGAPRGSAAYWPCVQQQQYLDQRDRAAWGALIAPPAVVVVRGY